jgi:hypothetical protein
VPLCFGIVALLAGRSDCRDGSRAVGSGGAVAYDAFAGVASLAPGAALFGCHSNHLRSALCVVSGVVWLG